jgi:hypothetical protein
MPTGDGRRPQAVDAGRIPSIRATVDSRRRADTVGRWTIPTADGIDTPARNRIPCHVINSRPFNMADVWPALGRPIDGRLAVCATIFRRLASIIGNIDGRLLAYFRACFRLDLPQICARGGEPTRAGLKRNRTRIYSPTHRPSKTPSATSSAFHRRFVGYHRPSRRLRLTPVHCARKRLAHIALRLYDERFVCSGCFRRLR